MNPPTKTEHRGYRAAREQIRRSLDRLGVDRVDLIQLHNLVDVIEWEVALGAGLPMGSLDEMARFVTHDWAKINPLRGGWIERFNREMAK